MLNRTELNNWFEKHREILEKAFNLKKDMDINEFPLIFRVFDTKQEFNNPENWVATPWERSIDPFSEMVADHMPVVIIDGKWIMFDTYIYTQIMEHVIKV